MDEIYYALKNAPDNDITNQYLTRLSNIPTVYFPDMKLVVPAKRVVISCKEEEEIHPYLLKCPDSFSQYTNVFIRLGASKELSCDSFACALRCLKEKTLKAGGPELTPQEYSDAIKAMQYFFRYLAFETKTITISGESLYFLSEAETIENSNMLVVSNNMYFKSALDRSNTERRMFLIGFGTLFEKNMRIDNCVENLQYLPETQKPYLLTEVVVERVVLDNIKKMTRNEALKLEEFIHGTDFLYGFLRLYRHTLELQGIKWNIEIETKFANHMKKVTFEQCSGIETVLYMKNIESGRKLGKEVLIENTNEKRFVHTEISEKAVCVYFDTSDSNWKQNVKKEITVYLNGLTCEKSFDAQTSLNLSEIIGMFDTPREIEMYLSQARIKEYTFETDILDESYSYPIPGDIVEERFHRYLDNDFGLIYEFDFKFVALEVDDPSFDAELEEDGEDDEQQNGKYTPTYMYVHIIRQLEPENELPLFQEYEIDFAKLPKCFPQTFQEACKEVRKILTEAWKKHENDRKRIVKRLMLKWHPDKNPDNVNFCTKVFQYIQQCLNRLDNGLDLQEEDDDSDSHTTGRNFSSNTSGTYWSSSGSYGNTRYDRYWRRYDRGRRYNESRYSNTSYNNTSSGNNSSRGTSGYYRNFHSYWRSSRRYTHTSYEPYHWYSMARIWHKQAELDLRQARESIELQEHPQYNWSCYNAHQAAEKALKAAWYSKDAKKIGISVSGHDLEALARDLDPSLRVVAREMSNLTGDYSAMRYPRTHTAQVPSEIYTRTKATGMIELAQKIITLVQNSYIR
ncbi:sacsin-like [Ruditapes philippinarum]|uniref:sacsin-like n=1 Tax=Ruditapes philippinarum TaxID=129788 RepID=UPI00295B3DA3|nr:sacsin-like [Ruditapes philippinarum]